MNFIQRFDIRGAVMRTIRVKAIAVGLLIDIVGGFSVGIVLSLFIAILASNDKDTSTAHLLAINANFYIKLVGLVGTLCFTALGGYVAARLSMPDWRSNSVAVGVISLLLGILLALWQPGITPQWKLILGLLATVPSAFIGGRFALPCNSQQLGPTNQIS
jgi:hypothetical protein